MACDVCVCVNTTYCHGIVMHLKETREHSEFYGRP